MRGLIQVRVPIDEAQLARLADRAPGARDWSEALQWLLDAFEDLIDDGLAPPGKPQEAHRTPYDEISLQPP